ncbi:MAG TPA: helix-turn-helix transcriptional regulator, partial [Solirubrobacteraceae bacterium]
ALALLAAHRGDAEAAAATGARALALSRRGGVAGSRANTLLTVAALRRAAGAADEALELVAEARAILTAAPDPGPMVLERLERAERPAAARRTAPAAPGRDDLSDRELAVLRLLATDLSQREIADALFISVNTVKTHVRHICEKLRASGRDDAVRRARQRGLLG